jgi:uncharacterized protein (DUF697 family)
MFILKRYVPPKEQLKNKETLNQSSDFKNYSAENSSSKTNLVDSPTRHRKLLIVLTAICLSAYGALELTHFQCSSTYYQYFGLKITAPTAARIMSAMAGSYTAGRCLSAFIAIKVKPEIMIIYHFGTIIAAMCVLFFGQNYITLIWIGNVMMGKKLRENYK